MKSDFGLFVIGEFVGVRGTELVSTVVGADG